MAGFGSWGRCFYMAPEVLAQPLSGALPGAPKAGEAVVLRAESLEFFRQAQRLLAMGQVVVESGDTRMFADRLEMNTETGVGVASGHVRFVTPVDDVQASTLEFNLSADQGILYDAKGVVDGTMRISGQRIERRGPKRFHVHRGRVTACHHERPDWEFRTSRARIGVGNYATLKDPSFWIKGVPVFYLPYLILPVKDERTTGLLPPSFGYSDKDGAALRSSFFWAMTDWMDSTVGLEYLSERGYKPDAEFRYAIDPLSGGQVKGAYIYDQLTDEPLWRVLLQQQQEFGWGLRGVTQVDLRSEGDLVRRFSRDVLQEAQVDTASYGTLTKRFANSVMAVWGASLDGIPESGATQQFQRLPTLSFEQFLTPLIGPALFGLEASYDRLQASDVADGATVQRLDVFPSITLPWPIAPWLQLTLSTGLRGTYYDRRATDGDAATRWLPEARAHVAGPAWRRRFAGAEAAQGWTHVMSTSLEYRYTPDIDQDDLPGFESLDEALHLLDPIEAIPLIDRVAAANYARLSMAHRLFMHGEQVREVARLTLSQGFDIEAAGDGGGRLLGPLDVEIESALSIWRLSAMLRLAPRVGDMEAASTQLAVALGRYAQISAAHHYRQAPDVQYLTAGVNTSLFDRRLRLGYTMRFDGLEGAIRAHGLTLQFLAQCWQVAASMQIRNTEDTPFFSRTSFTFEVRLFEF